MSGMASPLNLVEFPADDPERALRFWTELLGLDLQPRTVGEGWQTAASSGPAVGVHERGRGPGDSFSLPYFEVDDLATTLAQVKALGIVSRELDEVERRCHARHVTLPAYYYCPPAIIATPATASRIPAACQIRTRSPRIVTPSAIVTSG